jgi:hypothetical protein
VSATKRLAFYPHSRVATPNTHGRIPVRDGLVELCSVLKSEVHEQVAAGSSGAAAFAAVAQEMLEDVQQRLSYRTQCVQICIFPANLHLSC